MMLHNGEDISLEIAELEQLRDILYDLGAPYGSKSIQGCHSYLERILTSLTDKRKTIPEAGKKLAHHDS